MSTKKRQEYPIRLSHAQEYLILKAFAWLVRVVPRRLALFAGAMVGQLGWWIRIRRKVVFENLALALPDASPAERRKVGSRAARNFGRTAVEFFRFPGKDRERLDELVTLDGAEALHAALEEGRGAIVVTGHLGAWALYVTALAAAGIPTGLLVGRQHNPKVDRFIHSIPGDAVTFISKGKSAPRGILRSLKGGQAIVLVADHNSRRHGVRAPFFGRETSTLPLPGAFAARQGAPLFLMVGHRGEDGRHSVRLERLEVPAIDDETILRHEIARTCNDALGEAIREHPDQYFWYHRRFRPADADLPPIPEPTETQEPCEP